MTDLDFTKIRTYNHSQNSGFEELICQLAHLEPPDQAAHFIRKNGAGGDGGIECYWILKNGSEHAWQAKYFIDKLGNPQWKQILKSVESALQKHPNLKKYYICLPRDLTDHRKHENSDQSNWNKHKQTWEKIAKDREIDVEFYYWGKHEISLRLATTKSEYSGRAHYWFNSPFLTLKRFQEIANDSKSSLHEGYTPESHVELPIEKIFEGLGRTQEYWGKLETQINNWHKTSKNTEATIAMCAKLLNDKNLITLTLKTNDLFSQICFDIQKKSITNNIAVYKKKFKALLEKLDLITHHISSLKPDNQEYQLIQLRRFESETSSLSKYLNSNTFKAAEQRCVLLEGEAGIGKSHLLCRLTLKRLDEKLPTLFLLGQHYRGGNPVAFLKEKMDLSNLSDQTFLGALDAAGEASRANTLIIIDAINEGYSQADWDNHLSLFLKEILRFPNLSLALSCRTTYINYIIKKILINNPLIKITHTGFRGCINKATTKYFNYYGISKPNTLITISEFTNPLFLKICCKALQKKGLTSFPTRLEDVSKLFEIHIKSIDEIVARKKQYQPGEYIIREALEAFAESLCSNSLYEPSTRSARKLINSFDPKPNYGDPLFDLLIQEGFLSCDVTFGENLTEIKQVVRLTYKRFSDLFIAQHLFKGITKNSLHNEFKIGGRLDFLCNKNDYYKNAGVIGYLGILISETWHQEIIDLIPQDLTEDSWFFDQIFTAALLWRSKTSFTKRTVELLNTIAIHENYAHSLDILIALSTEPSHPWNTEFLHKNLSKMPMPERDSFWSTHIAICDYNESEDQEESSLRSLIEWAHYGDMTIVENERIRLCAMVLMWTTSSSNSKVRDHATKAIVRILTAHPKNLNYILEKFCDIDDFYVLERLYAVAYGVITNIDNDQIIKEVSNFVFNKIFISGNPPPHLLLRDYCSSIMEIACIRKLLDDKLDPNFFRAPFKSQWPLLDPTEKKLNKIINDTHALSIKSSIMGIMGDFGNYSVNAVLNWSSTPIKHSHPKTAYEFQSEFAEILSDDLRLRYLEYINRNKKIDNDSLDEQKLLRDLNILLFNAKPESQPSKYEILKKEIESILTFEQNEQFVWITNIGGSNSIALYNKKLAQRWICKKAIELGWTQELFEEFERYNCKDFLGQTEKKIDRIGKKYQWIALHELLASLSDNLHFIGPNINSLSNSKYLGPWQISLRDIDPTCWLRKSEAKNQYNNGEKDSWWQPFVYPFSGKTLESLNQWLWDKSQIPSFEKLLQVQDPSTNLSWYVLKTYVDWKKKPKNKENKMPSQNAWYRINSCIVHKKDVPKLKKALKGKNLCNPYILQSNSIDQGFLKEYPWHSIFKDLDGWTVDHGAGLEIQHLNPTSIYESERHGSHNSLDKAISIYLPSKKLIEDLKLSHDLKVPGQWHDDKNHIIFFDPSILLQGPSAALVKKEDFIKWLDNNDYQLVWIIGGAKELQPMHYKKCIYSGIYTLSKNKITGKIWWIKE